MTDQMAPRRGEWEDDNQREAYEERAAIMEFDGGMTREEAERRAMELFHNPGTKALA